MTPFTIGYNYIDQTGVMVKLKTVNERGQEFSSTRGNNPWSKNLDTKRSIEENNDGYDYGNIAARIIITGNLGRKKKKKEIRK